MIQSVIRPSSCRSCWMNYASSTTRGHNRISSVIRRCLVKAPWELCFLRRMDSEKAMKCRLLLSWKQSHPASKQIQSRPSIISFGIFGLESKPRLPVNKPPCLLPGPVDEQHEGEAKTCSNNKKKRPPHQLQLQQEAARDQQTTKRVLT